MIAKALDSLIFKGRLVGLEMLFIVHKDSRDAMSLLVELGWAFSTNVIFDDIEVELLESGSRVISCRHELAGLSRESVVRNELFLEGFDWIDRVIFR